MAMASQVMKMVGTHMQAGGMMMRGMAEEEKGKFLSKQLKRNAAAIEAQGQRAASSERTKGSLVKSTATAQMAAGGGGVDTAMLADIQDRADYNALAAIFESETKGSALRDEAKLRLEEGRQAKRETRMAAAGTVISGLGSAMGGGMMGGGSGGTSAGTGVSSVWSDKTGYAR